MNVSAVLRLIATICFVLAIFGVPLGSVPMIALGLACWCGSSLT